MDQGKMKDLADTLDVHRMLSHAHDKKLISYDDFKKACLKLNDVTHAAITALLP